MSTKDHEKGQENHTRMILLAFFVVFRVFRGLFVLSRPARLLDIDQRSQRRRQLSGPSRAFAAAVPGVSAGPGQNAVSQLDRIPTVLAPDARLTLGPHAFQKVLQLARELVGAFAVAVQLHRAQMFAEQFVPEGSPSGRSQTPGVETESPQLL